MVTTDTTEKGLEALIVRDLVASGYVQGKSSDYNRDVALDVAQLMAFLEATQPRKVDALELRLKASSARNSCTGFRARSPSAAWWMCCAKA